jgi:tetratricopeptide (TPR) repeat protein
VSAITARYADLVQQYAGASTPDGVSALASWPTEDVERAVQRFAGIARARPKRGDQQAVLASQLRAAVGLHTAIAADAWRDGASDRLAAHVEFANAYIPDLLAVFDPGYAADWCRIAGTLLTSSQQQALALRQIDRCLAWFQQDPGLDLARGSARESAAQALEALPPGAMLAYWPELHPVAATERARAAADYERAVALDPGLDEAWIRLGHLRLVSGDLEAASDALGRAAATPPASVPGYWRALVLGAVAEAQKRPDEAAARYRAALDAYPKGQAAAVALSHVMAENLGDRAGAAQILREHLAASPARVFASDPWWLYNMGQAWRVSGWLEDLARRSRTDADER